MPQKSSHNTIQRISTTAYLFTLAQYLSVLNLKTPVEASFCNMCMYAHTTNSYFSHKNPPVNSTVFAKLGLYLIAHYMHEEVEV